MKEDSREIKPALSVWQQTKQAGIDGARHHIDTFGLDRTYVDPPRKRDRRSNSPSMAGLNSCQSKREIGSILSEEKQQPESRMRENRTSGSEGGGTRSKSLLCSPPRVNLNSVPHSSLTTHHSSSEIQRYRAARPASPFWLRSARRCRCSSPNAVPSIRGRPS